MKFLNITILLTLAANLVAANSPLFSAFKENDIKHFLKDRKINTDNFKTYDELSKVAQEEYEKLQSQKSSRSFTVDVSDNDQQQILNLATDPNADLNDIFPHNWDYLTSLTKEKTEDDSSSYYSQLKNWVFESWTLENLKSYLTSNKVKFDKKHATRQDLIDLAKSSYDDVIEKFNVSGVYAGDWLYEGWSIDDIKNWLSEHEIEFDPKATKDQLLDSIKENNYIASLSNIDNKESLLDSLNLPEHHIFDEAGKIKSEFYDTWSYSQLREWLYYHGLITTKPNVDAKDLDLEKLKTLARSHENYLISDIKGWIDSSKKKADPYLSKKPENWKSKLDGFINSSFLVGIDNWSKDRLKQFLKVRNVKFSQFSTKRQLIELVKSSKNIPVKYNQSIGVPASWFFENWSTESLRNWVQEKGESIDGSRQDLYNSINNYYKNIDLNPSKSIKEQTKFYKPDLDEFKLKLQDSHEKTKGKLNEKNRIADETILAAYSLGLEYYNQASKTIGNKYSENKFELNEALNQAQKSSFDYSKKLIEESKKGKINVQENLESAAKAATDYANDLSVTLVESYTNSKPVVENFFDDSVKYAKGLLAAATGLFYQHKPLAEQAAQGAYGSAKDYINSINNIVNEKYEGVKPSVDAAVSQSKEYADAALKVANDHYNEYQPKVASAYDQANSAAASAYGEYQPKAVEAYSKANAAAASAYDEYKPLVEEAAKNSYESAKKYSNDANQAIQSAYEEYQPKIAEATKNGYDYVLQAYSNADLKSYLKSFGFDNELLNGLNRGQLLKLSQEQSNLFYGNSKTKWDKSIVEVLSDSATGVQQKLGLKSEPTSAWSKFRSYF